MPRSDAETLTKLREIKDKIEDDIAAGEAVTSYRIGDREVTRQDPFEALSRIQTLINKYEQKTDNTGGVNLADFS